MDVCIYIYTHTHAHTHTHTHTRFYLFFSKLGLHFVAAALFSNTSLWDVCMHIHVWLSVLQGMQKQDLLEILPASKSMRKQGLLALFLHPRVYGSKASWHCSCIQEYAEARPLGTVPASKSMRKQGLLALQGTHLQ
jgi:hypothetical protein